MIVDFCAGPGGWDHAAKLLGLDVLGVELDAAACASREAAGLSTVQADIREYQPPRRLTGIIESAPCTGWSEAGKQRGWDDPTGPLLEHAATLAIEHEPEWIALENTRRVLPIFEAFAEDFRDMGYSTWTGLLHAEQYGVPQTRTRAILLASRVREVHAPAPTHSRYYPRDPGRLDLGVRPWVSMAEALGWGLTDRPSYTVTGGGTATGGAEPYGRRAREAMVREEDRGAWQRSPQSVAGEGRAHRHVSQPSVTVTGNFDRARWVGEPQDWPYNRPSPTIVGSFCPDVVAAPGWRKAGDGPRQKAPGSVRITVKEAGVLQSFPRDYPWQGAQGKQYQQVGNAIPPLLAGPCLSVVTGIPWMQPGEVPWPLTIASGGA